jgi:ribosomal protein S12 methylthiotransferase accessory factor
MRRTSPRVKQPDETTGLPWKKLARALGVTRIARVTDLDRTGVEVACAVRPGGHVLQVSQGKGLAFREAAAGALLEAAELACAERVDTAELAWASERELRARKVPHLAPSDLGGEATGEATGEERLAWREARDLSSGEPVLAPAAALHVPPQGGPALGLAGPRWTSNGMGAHPSWMSALLHALLEAVERDQLARALPVGWTEGDIAARILSTAAARGAAPRVASLAERVERRGFDVHLFDLAPEGGMGLPIAGALLFDRQRGPVPLTAGYACRLGRASALEAALLEAAQSRLTDIHGAREDVVPADGPGVERLRRACDRARARAEVPAGKKPRPADEAPGSLAPGQPGSASRYVTAVLASLQRAGHARAVAVDLAPARLGVHVAKVLVPGLLLSGLL